MHNKSLGAAGRQGRPVAGPTNMGRAQARGLKPVLDAA